MNRTVLSFTWLGILFFLLHACNSTPTPVEPEAFPAQIISLRVGQPGWVLTSDALYGPDRQALDLPARERGHRLSAAWVDDGQSIWVGYDLGRVYHTSDGGSHWQEKKDGYEVPDMVLIDLSLRRPIPRQFVRLSDGTLYLATIGRGVLLFDEAEDIWVDASWAFDLEGALNPMAWTLASTGRGLVAGFVNPKGIVPPEYTELFGESIREMATPGEDFEQLALPEQVRLVTGLAIRDGRTLVASLGHGVLQQSDQGWEQLWTGEPPTDLWAIDVDARGQMGAVTLSGDVWWSDGTQWRRVLCGGNGTPGSDVRFDGDRLLAAVGDTMHRLGRKALNCPNRGGARVLLAFSQHTNFYHSYRGDSEGEDGFGKDIRIIRQTLDMFDARPTLKNDWDIENLFSLDDWMPQYCPDILDDIARRVESGADGIRLMSWNNGLMACEPADEFALSMDRAKESLQAFVPGLWSAGVQPQENTYTPAHPALYRQHGVDWITLFYSATSFTGFRAEVPLSLADAHSLLTLTSDLGPETMTLVPVYHHADVMEHGGLANWLRQLHQNLDGTVALVIHFDADGDTWLGFGSELDDVLAMDADWVEPRRLQDIVAELPAGAPVNIRRDLADGAFDGFSSWTEKPANQRFYTRVVRSRLLARAAQALANGTVTGLDEALAAAREARLRTMSTTHFGLANPSLHPEREAAGDLVSIEAETQASAGLVLAAGVELTPGTPAAFNPNPVAGYFLQPVDQPLTAAKGSLRSLGSADGTKTWLAGAVSAQAVLDLEDAVSDMTEASASFEGWAPPDLAFSVSGPRLRIDGLDVPAQAEDVRSATGDGGQVWTVIGSWPQGEGGAVRYDWIRLDDAPDQWWLAVDITFPRLADDQMRWWEEAVPVEFALPQSDSWLIDRLLVTGERTTYEVSTPFDALNNHAADGFLAVSPSDGSGGLSLTAYSPLRSAPAFAPLRIARGAQGGLEATLAPFAVLWGELLDHRARHLLGTGVGEYATRLVSPQIQSTAPAWNGQRSCFLIRLAPPDALTDEDAIPVTRDGLVLFDEAGQVQLPRGCF